MPKERIFYELSILVGDVFGFLFFLLSAIYLAGVIKIQFFSDTYIIRALKICVKEERFKIRRFIGRFIFEIKPRTEKQRRKNTLMLYLLLKSISYIFLGVYLLNPTYNLVCGAIALIMFLINPKIILKYINKTLKD